MAGIDTCTYGIDTCTYGGSGGYVELATVAAIAAAARCFCSLLLLLAAAARCCCSLLLLAAVAARCCCFSLLLLLLAAAVVLLLLAAARSASLRSASVLGILWCGVERDGETLARWVGCNVDRFEPGRLPF